VVEDVTDSAEEQPPGRQIIVPPDHQGGVYANFAIVSHSEHEFTLDFIRNDPLTNMGVVVARVAVSPLLITQLQDALEENWKKFAAKAMPKGVFEDGEETTGGKPGATE
jgi:hypothetical protein